MDDSERDLKRIIDLARKMYEVYVGAKKIKDVPDWNHLADSRPWLLVAEYSIVEHNEEMVNGLEGFAFGS